MFIHEIKQNQRLYLIKLFDFKDGVSNWEGNRKPDEVRIKDYIGEKLTRNQ